MAAEIVSTGAWTLTVPGSVTRDAPLLVIPTVHPRGDRRIIRCAQVALDAGFRIQFVWLGEGAPSVHAAIGETLLPSPASRRQRLSSVRRVADIARGYEASAWHIHDFYFLQQARKWHRRTNRPVLYDVHEYYGEYYAAMLPLPSFLKQLIARTLDEYQVRAAKRIGGANVVTELMARPFRAAQVPVAVSPNYPLLEQFARAPEVPFAARRWQVLHIGTLTPDYGTALLVTLAQRSLQRGLPFEFSVIARFPSQHHEREFELLLEKSGDLPNLRLLPPRPAHEMPHLIANSGFGLSLLAPDGQNEAAVPSKNYEHVMLKLVDVVTDRAAQRRFVEEHAVGVVGDESQPDRILDEMVALGRSADSVQPQLDEKAKLARSRFTWEGGVAPGLSALFQELMIS